MTSDAATADFTDHQPLHCYRHPDRETWVRCGRCDQPICTGCAMQGPVGLRCRTCGKPARDALATLRPQQIAIAAIVAAGLGAAVGYFGAQLGLLTIVIGFFAGTFIAEALDRSVGIKRGPRILAIAIIGIVVGGLLGATFSLVGSWREIQAFAESTEGAGLPDYPLETFLLQSVPTALMGLVATCVGVAARLRR